MVVTFREMLVAGCRWRCFLHPLLSVITTGKQSTWFSALSLFVSSSALPHTHTIIIIIIILGTYMCPISGEPEVLTFTNTRKTLKINCCTWKIKPLSSTRNKSTNTTENGWTVGLSQDNHNYTSVCTKSWIITHTSENLDKSITQNC